MKVEEKLEGIKKLNLSDEEDKANEYEVLLRKLESDIRLHIKVFLIYYVYKADNI